MPPWLIVALVIVAGVVLYTASRSKFVKRRVRKEQEEEHKRFLAWRKQRRHELRHEANEEPPAPFHVEPMRQDFSGIYGGVSTRVADNFWAAIHSIFGSPKDRKED
ncbi:MAG: hypothetical protein ACREQI_09410 [Candidatus Binataceae bacterium]